MRVPSQVWYGLVQLSLKLIWLTKTCFSGFKLISINRIWKWKLYFINRWTMSQSLKTILLTHWSYWSPALSHRCVGIILPNHLVNLHREGSRSHSEGDDFSDTSRVIQNRVIDGGSVSHTGHDGAERQTQRREQIQRGIQSGKIAQRWLSDRTVWITLGEQVQFFIHGIKTECSTIF